MTSQRTHYIQLKRKRDDKDKTDCNKDRMKVFITNTERQLVDQAQNRTAENRNVVVAEGFSIDRQQNDDNILADQTHNTTDENRQRRPTVLIPWAMRLLVDDKLRQQSEDNRRVGPQPMPIRLPVVVLTQIALPDRLPALDHQTPPANLPDRVVVPPPRVPIRRRHADVPHRITYRHALRGQNCENATPFRLGPPDNPTVMTEKCRFCAAEFFSQEARGRTGDRYACCGFGKVNVPLLKECPLELRELYTGDDQRCINFRLNIRSANSMFAMASFKATIPADRNVGQGHWCFHVTGQIYHYASRIPNNENPNSCQYNQFYFIDAQDAINRRSAFFGRLFDQEVITTIEHMLRRDNALVIQYMSMAEVIRQRREEQRGNGDGEGEGGPAEIFLAFRDSLAGRVRINGLPTEHTEVAAVYVGEEPPRNVDLVIYERERGINRSCELKNLNPLADPMVYPLLFPKGETGYRMKTRLTNQPRTLVQRGGRLEPVVIDNYDGPEPNQNDVLPPDDAAGVPMPRRRPTSRQYVTMRQFYRHRLQIRRPIHHDTNTTQNADELFMPPEFSALHNGGKLFQQYVVDAWVRVEADQLWYIKQNQRTLRKTNYSAIQRYLENRARNQHAQIGQIVVLPRSFTGGQRNINRRYLDAMTTVARHGKPDIFITFTCNPNWPEIKNNLQHKQKFEHRPDLVCRVFYNKLMELIDDLYRKQYFGVALNYMYSVEYQLRGLPHAHILLTLRPEDRLVNEDDVDAAVQAAFPDRRQEPGLFNMISKHMIHGPCGAHNPNSPCMKDGRCSKHYPKVFRERTDLVGDVNRLNQPEYKRPQNNRGIDIRGVFVDNTWVVPFNKHLLVKYDCHVNVELCGSIQSIKYLHKYVNKGPDYCNIRQAEVQQADGAAQEQRAIDWDEVQQYQNYRYVSSQEAVWRLFEYPIHDRSHAVIVLPVHLPGERDVIFDQEDEADDIRRLAERSTKLEAWFTLNVEHAEARGWKYHQIPENYTWDDRNNIWRPRRNVSKTLGCVAEVSPADGDRFYLRMLLTAQRGATSFMDLRTVNGRTYDSFLEACRVRNMLVNNDEYERCLRDGAETRSPFRLRVLFALVSCLMLNSDTDPERIRELWLVFKQQLCDDFLQRGDTQERAELNAAYHVQTSMRRSTFGRESIIVGDLGLPNVDANDPAFADVAIDLDELRRHDVGDLDSATQQADGEGRAGFANRVVTLNNNQRAVFHAVMTAIDNYMNNGPLFGGNLFFVDGPGGTGKTYLYNTIIDEVQVRFAGTCLPVAWTGIAATLLRGGRTVHSTFRLPLTLTDQTVAGFPLESERSQVIRDAAAILWDEAPMTPRKAVEAVDRYLRNLMGRPEIPMGGKVVLFGGDFRQLLPVMTRAHSGQIIEASLKRWPLWQSVTIHRLTVNLRVSSAANGASQENLSYANLLLRIGDGTEPVKFMPAKPSAKNLIELPKHCLVADRASLVDFVYGIAPVDTAVEGLAIADKAILCPTNRAVNEVNSCVLDRIEGAPVTYYSVDSYMGDEDDGLHVPQDLLHAVNVSSLGPHELTLKVGAVVMLIRNLDLSAGLCNGTRLRVLALRDNMIELQVLTGGSDVHRGRVVYLPRMDLTAHPSSGTNVPGPMRRVQFPIRLAFAMTINKSQGQTFKTVGVYLDTPCFTHGQLYVAMSRVGSPNSIRLFVNNSTAQGAFSYRDGRRFTPNVVFKQIVLDGLPTGDSQRYIGPPEDRDPLRPEELRRDPIGQDVASSGSDVQVDIAGGLSQFYVDDWDSQFVNAIDRQVADVRRRDDVSEMPVDPVDRRIVKGIRIDERRPYSPASQQEVDDDYNYSDQPLPIIPPAADLPHPELPARVSVGTRAGTSGLGRLADKRGWWQRPPQTDTDSDSE